MEVRGIIFITRIETLKTEFGIKRVEKFVQDLAAKIPLFRSTVLATTLIPVADFLAFCEESLNTFNRGDVRQWEVVGQQTAAWSLTRGPYAIHVSNKNAAKIFEIAIPRLWNAFFVGGKLEATMQGNIGTLRISRIPVHLLFEYLSLGYCKKAVELPGATCEVRRIKSFSAGDSELHFEFTINNPSP